MAVLVPPPNVFTPRPYQRDFWRFMENGGKRFVGVWHRRAGKDLNAIAWTAREACIHPGIYWHIGPTLRQARRFVWNGMTVDTFNPRRAHRYRDVFPKEMVLRQRDDEMMIELRNGSIWQVLGTDDPDSLVGPNPRGIVFSEYSIQNPAAWELLSPILAENEGWAVFIYCVAPDTMVLSEDGMVEIQEAAGSAPDGYSEHRANYYGLGGFHEAEQVYRGPRQRVLTLTTAKGYKLTCTPVHPIWTGTEWRKAKEWSVGDKMPIQLGQDAFGSYVPDELPSPDTHGHNKSIPFDIDADLYYFLGLMIAEGSWSSRICHVSNQDDEIIEFLKRHGFVHRGGASNNNCNTNLCGMIDWFGVQHGAHNKDLPEKIRRAPKWAVREVLRGLFDGDGCARKDGAVQFDSVSERLIDQVQVMLLNFGILAGKSLQIVQPTERVSVESRCYRLFIGGHMAARFYERIGFRLTRKQERLELLSDRQKRQRQDAFDVPDGAIPDDYWVGMDAAATRRQAERGVLSWATIEKLSARKPLPWFDKILSDGFHYDPIASIEESESDVIDFVIPETHSFFSNGMVSHNTPRGRNHGYRLLKSAEKLHRDQPGRWFAQNLTIDDTTKLNPDGQEVPVVTPEMIQEERDRGKPEEEIQQEYYGSFEAPMHGSFYGDLMHEIAKEGRVCEVRHDPELPVHTWWDIGYDYTAIIFMQVVGDERRFIDFEGGADGHLDLWIRKVLNKPYTYGNHIGPWDIVKRGAVGGKRMVDEALKLGLRFTKCPKHWKDDAWPQVRMYLRKHRCYFDAVKCEVLVDALHDYHREWDDNKQTFLDNDVHNWASHPADAFRVGVMHEPQTDTNSFRAPVATNAYDVLEGVHYGGPDGRPSMTDDYDPMGSWL